MAGISSPSVKSVERVKNGETGILQSSLSPKYLHTNSTSHTWPFSAIAELIDNAYDPDVKASQFWIDKIILRGKTCLAFTDNGYGMTASKLHKMLSFGFCEKVALDGHMPVGHYGNGFKSGSMRLGKNALVLTKKKSGSRSIGFLSQTYLENIKAETIVVPITSWNKVANDYVIQPEGAKALQEIMKHSLINNDDEINEQFDAIPGMQGTRIIISDIRKGSDNRYEFDFYTNLCDIRVPDDGNADGGKYRQTKRQNHIPECDYSLKAYCAILYLKPRMQIIVRGKKVKTINVEKSLSQTEVDRYKPQWISDPMKVVFGFNSLNKNHYGIMMYHRNRLIKPYERVGYQLRANNLGVGVVGVVQCDFLKPTHNKQDFDYTSKYRLCMTSLGIKLNEYWNEKKGAASRVTNSLPANLAADEPIEAPPDQTWVQCDEPTCLKWRKLPASVEENSLPEKWYCHMNPDVNFKSCDKPEEKDDDPPAMPYAKVQRRRLEKELQEKNKREKETKAKREREEEEKTKKLREKEEALNKKEQELEKKIFELKETKPKIKAEGAKLPTAQVSPRSTTVSKSLRAVTPITNQSPTRNNQASQLRTSPAIKRSVTSPQKIALQSPQRAVSGTSTSRPTTSSLPRVIAVKPDLSKSPGKTPTSTMARLTPTPAQSTPIRLPPSSARPTFTLVHPTPARTTSTLVQPMATPTVKVVSKPSPSNNKAGQVSFKLIKSPDGSTFLVPEKAMSSVTNAISTSPATVKVLTQAVNQVAANAAKLLKTPSSPSKLDIKPKLSVVLPKPKTPTSTSMHPPTSNIVTIGIKREPSTAVTNPSPAKVAKTSDVIVIDAIVPSANRVLKQDTAALTAVGDIVKRLKTEYEEKIRKLQVSLITSKAEFTSANTKLSAKTKELDEMKKRVEGKTKQLKDLRGNVCKLLQVLVPEIDVDCEDGQGDVDELLKQVLEANQ